MHPSFVETKFESSILQAPPPELEEDEEVEPEDEISPDELLEASPPEELLDDVSPELDPPEELLEFDAHPVQIQLI